MSDEGMRCHACEAVHTDWEHVGSQGVDDGSHVGIIEAWECGRCGAITEGGRL